MHSAHVVPKRDTSGAAERIEDFKEEIHENLTLTLIWERFPEIVQIHLLFQMALVRAFWLICYMDTGCKGVLKFAFMD